MNIRKTFTILEFEVAKNRCSLHRQISRTARIEGRYDECAETIRVNRVE